MLEIASRRWIPWEDKSILDRRCDQILTVYFYIQGVTLVTRRKIPTGDIWSPTDLVEGFGRILRMPANTG
jgi:hypothetical protein